jgi:hypothetical protein
MKKRIVIPAAVAILFLIVTIFSGCGKTGDPRPTQMVEAKKRLSTLALDQSECGVILTWNMNEYRTIPDMVKIYRTDFNIAEGDCKDCPGTRRLVAELSRAELSYIREYDGSYVYFDKKVQKDFVYKYVIVVCGEQGICSEPSDESEIRFTYAMESCP